MLKIYEASAGSGKTFTLASEYLLLALNSPEKFKNILAITFTNKAAEEMKSRILEALDSLAKEKEQSPFYPVVESRFENLSPEQIAQRARDVKSAILHDYSLFAISTIDSFVQRVVRSFAYELRLPASFQIELDQNKVLGELVEMLFEKMGVDNDLENWLTKFMLSRLQDGKHWNFRSAVEQLGGFIFREDFMENNIARKNTREALSLIENHINTVIEQYEEQRDKIVDRANRIFADTEMSSRSKAGIIKKFFTETILAGKIALNKTIEALLNGEEVKLKEFEYLRNDILSLAEQFNDLYSNLYKDYITSLLIKENLYIFGVFSDLIQLLDIYRYKNNTWLIGEMNLLLHELVKENSDAPVVYEKIGQRLESLMIDEFQDTSRFQWYNFRPLIDHSVSLGNTSLVVGDVKQSIYRWRNGDWRLLLFAVPEAFKGRYQSLTLDTNWRSQKNIVDFNNSIFEVLPAMAQDILSAELAGGQIDGVPENENWDSIIINAYKDVKQKVSPKFEQGGGSVEITFIERQVRGKSLFYEAVQEELIDKIIELKNEGYAFSDIAILVRRNSEAVLVSQWFVEYNANASPEQKIDFISDESLFLSYSPAVRLIVEILGLVSEKIQGKVDLENEKDYLKTIVYFYKRSVEKEQTTINKIFESENPQELLPSDTISFIDSLQNKTLFEAVENIIEHFSLNNLDEQLPYIRSFENEVLDFVYSEGSDYIKFRQWWENTGQNSTVSLSSAADAVRILTIHKSKGLAFPVVLMPFADWSLKPVTNGYILVNSDKEPYSQLGAFPVRYSSALAHSYFAVDYYRELLYTLMDNLNVLYVAFTRPVSKLIVYASAKFKVETNVSSVGQLLYNAIDEKFGLGSATEGRIYFSLSDKYMPYPGKKSDINSFEVKKYITSDWRNRVDVATKASEELLSESGKREYGTLMHSILSQVIYSDDLHKVIKDFVNRGLLSIDKAEETEQDLKDLISTDNVKDWFSDKWQVYNERTIITDDGEEKRPDRVLENEKEIIVIDFKFGREHDQYHEQVREYMHKLKEQQPEKQVKGYLLYAQTKKVVEVSMESYQPKLF